jgi:TolB-like protein/Flp pilus assembly protein TadD
MTEQRVQRRLSAILAADVVGYSRLMGEDETGTLAALKLLRAELIDPTIAEYHGRTVKLMGDGALVEFPSVVDAVECAVSIQRIIGKQNADIPDHKKLAFRIGINLGDVIIDGDDIYGDGVNVAARLEALAEPGSICISDIVHQSIDGKLDLAFADMGAQQVKNIAKPVRAYQVILSGAADQQINNQPLANKPSIAVLPFDNMSNDADQEYFSDGMAEDLITDLSKISNLSVAARNASFSFKGQMPNIQDVVNKLGVAFVLEGSVRKMGDRLRINAQLIDGANGRHIWAERYDGNMAEIFDFQDRIRGEIIAALELTLTPSDQARTAKRQTENVEAYDLYLKGRERYFRYSPEALVDAFNCLEKAIELDPEFSDAHSYLSYCLFSAFMMSWPGVTGTLNQALASAQTAVSLDPNSAMAHTRLGWVLGFLKRFDDAIDSFETALSLEPDLAEVYSAYGEVLNFAGDPEKAVQFCERALQLDPYAPITWKFHLGHSYYDLGRLEEAIQVIEEVVNVVPKFFIPRLFLACAYVENGQVQKACDLIEEAGFSEDFFPRFAQKWPSYKNDDSRNRVYTALRKAGLSTEGVDKGKTSPPSLPDKPSIAVLPFDNMSNDPEQEYFSDGIAEDLITALSRFRWFFVIARNSSFTYKGKAVDVKQVAAELGVEYVIEGSVRKAGNRVRITAQLIDAATGRHIWAERYDRDLSDIFALQDEITAAITGAVGPSFAAAEEQRASRKPLENLDVWDLAMRANWHLWRINKADLGEAQRLFGEAVELDPNSSFAQSGLAFAYMREAGASLADDFLGNREKAYEAAQRAIELDEQDARAHIALAWVYHVRQENELASTACLKALQLNPNLADAEGFLGLICAHLGNYDEALLHIDKAVRLSPQDPSMQFWDLARVIAALVADRPEEYLEHAKQLTESSPNFIPGIRHFAAASANLGLLDEAKIAVEKALKLVPGDTIAIILASVPIVDTAARDRYIAGLRKVGYPE